MRSTPHAVLVGWDSLLQAVAGALVATLVLSVAFSTLIYGVVRAGEHHRDGQRLRETGDVALAVAAAAVLLTATTIALVAILSR
jgi:hypothetical protein